MAVGALGACAGSDVVSGPDAQGTCSDGSEGCACYGNGTCDEGLACRSELCVADEDPDDAETDAAPDGEAGSANAPEDGASGAAEDGSSSSQATQGAGGADGTGGADEDDSSASPAGGADAGGKGGSESEPTSEATGGESPDGTGGSEAGGSSTGGSATGGSATGGSAGQPTTSGPNLITNGDFSLGGEYWELTWQDGELASYSPAGGEFCIENPSGVYYLSFSLGYPPTASDAFAIEAGATYTLSYRAQGYAEITAKIGQAVSPYAEVASFDTFVNSTSLTTFSHLVTSAVAEPQAGLVFNGVLDYCATVCFDDVVLAKN